MIRVVIADDDALVREGLRMIVERVEDIEVVGTASNGVEAAEAAGTLEPDVILMDVRMPVLDGIEATRRIVDQDSETRVIILTTFERDEYVFEALRAGASGFLLKRVEPEHLIEAVRVVAVGDALLFPSVTRRLIEEFSTAAPIGDPSLIESLTDREKEVLTLIGQGLTNQELAERLFIADNTVKTHVKRILVKIGARDRAQAVVKAYESGLVR